MSIVYSDFFHFSILNIIIVLLTPFLLKLFPGKFLRYFSLFLTSLALLDITDLLEIDMSYFRKTLEIYNLNYPHAESKIFSISLLTGFLAYVTNSLFEKNYCKKELLYAVIYLVSGLSSLYSNNLIDLFVISEAMILSSAALIFMGPYNKSEKAAINYLITHLISGTMMLVGIILFNRSQHSFLLTDLNFEIKNLFLPDNSINLAKFLIFVSFLINSASFPFCFWPAKYYSKASNSLLLILTSNTSKIGIFSLLTYSAGLKYLSYLGVLTVFYGIFRGLTTGNITKAICFMMVSKLGEVMMSISQINLSNYINLSREISLNILFSVIFYSLLIIINGVIIDKYKSQKFSVLRASLANLDIKSVIYLICLIKITSIIPAKGGMSQYEILFANLNQILMFLKITLGLKFVSYLYIGNWEKYQILTFMQGKKIFTKNILKNINLVILAVYNKFSNSIKSFVRKTLESQNNFARYIIMSIDKSLIESSRNERKNTFSSGKDLKIILMLLSVIILIYKYNS